MDVLVVNVGSSTVKVQVVDEDGHRTFDEEVEGGPSTQRLDDLLDRAGPVGAVGHRLVHGGPDHVGPELVTDELLARLDSVVPLAPLHLPPELEVVRAVRSLRPELPAVACFDTAFHATIGPAAHLYALPPEWEDDLGVRRFGFHGLSHRYANRRAAELMDRPVEQLRTVTCHLGAGASLAAVAGGRSVDTTMGFTPMSGLVMATRSGDLDPGAVLWLQRQAGLGADEIEDALWHRAGLAGLSRRSGDLRRVLAGIEEGDPRCRLAVDVYVHRLRGAIASMAAAMGGLDALVFTGGVGERSALVRFEVAAGLGFLGVGVEPGDAVLGDRQPGGAEPAPGPEPDREVTAPGARVRTLVVHAREDLEVARLVRSTMV